MLSCTSVACAAGLVIVSGIWLLLPGTSVAGSLVGDYCFSVQAPLANSVKGGLPDLLFNEFHPEFPPLLTGQEIPSGGREAPGNGWALGWTNHVPQVGYDRWVSSDLRIPQDPRLALGKKFTLWMRIIYGGCTRNDRGYNLAVLPGLDGKPVLSWTTTADEEIAVNLRLTDTDGTVRDYRCVSSSRELLPRFSRWYDLALSFDAGEVILAATELGREGPGKTNWQSFKLGEHLELAATRGPMRILKDTNTAIERLRVYRGEALGVDQLNALAEGVRLPGPRRSASIEVGTERQLFLDDAVIARMSGLERVLHPVQKYPGNPVIRREADIDGLGPNFWGSVIYDPDEKLFKLWCQPLTFQQPEVCNHLYFVSTDGVNWTRPQLDILGPDNCFQPPGYRGGHAGMWLTLYKDHDEPAPQKRYKGFIQRDPYYYITSPDGLAWTVEGIAAHYTDDTTTIAYNPARHEYVKIGRFCPDGRSLALRLMMTCVSKTELAEGNCPWHLVMLPDEDDLAADPYTQFYFMPAFPYHNMYIGILGLYHSGPDDGTSECELTVSRDGLNWQRVCRGHKFIERGAPGSWDGGFMVVPGTGPIRVGDELWFYYGANSGTHHALKEAAIGLGKLRLDGFVSLHAGSSAGHILTKPFRLEGDSLQINAVARGSVEVRLLDVPSGAQMARGEPFSGDACHHQIEWHSLSDLAAFQGEQVQIEFILRDADLYAFQVGDRGQL